MLCNYNTVSNCNIPVKCDICCIYHISKLSCLITYACEHRMFVKFSLNSPSESVWPEERIRPASNSQRTFISNLHYKPAPCTVCLQCISLYSSNNKMYILKFSYVTTNHLLSLYQCCLVFFSKRKASKKKQQPFFSLYWPVLTQENWSLPTVKKGN